MENILTITLLIALATYEVTDWLVFQVGPYEVFHKIRKYFNAYNEDEQGLIGEILECPYCTKVWVAIFISCIALIDYRLLIPLSAMGLITILLDYKE